MCARLLQKVSMEASCRLGGKTPRRIMRQQRLIFPVQGDAVDMVQIATGRAMSTGRNLLIQVMLTGMLRLLLVMIAFQKSVVHVVALALILPKMCRSSQSFCTSRRFGLGPSFQAARLRERNCQHARGGSWCHGRSPPHRSV